MNYRDFNLGDWIGHISGVIEDETTLDGNEMRDLVWFLTTLKQEPCEDTISRQAAIEYLMTNMNWYDEDGYESDDDYKRECITDLINGVPSVTPARKK